MSGSLIKCGDFEGEDKSGSPAAAVLSEVYSRVFHLRPRGRLSLAFTEFLGRKRNGIEGLAEAAIMAVKYDEIGKISPEVCASLLPELKKYQQEILGRLGIADDAEEISSRMTRNSAAKYGWKRDDGWHAYCLHDLIIAFEKSVGTQTPVEVIW